MRSLRSVSPIFNKLIFGRLFLFDNKCRFKGYLPVIYFKKTMDKWVTVLTTTLPQQLWIIRGRLESEGIECFIKDELTVQSYNLYSNAVGGVKLQVLEKDQQRAVEILIELGYLKDEPYRPDLLTVLDQKTSNLFLLNRLTVAKRVIVLTILVISVLVVILYFVFKPDTY